MAAPKVKIDKKQREQVETLASIGCTWKEISAVTKIAERTLQRRCGDLFKRGQERLKASLRRMQYESAKKGCAAMLIWLGKQYLGQTEKTEIVKPIEVTVKLPRGIKADAI